jgi:hypothetical protein
MESNVSRNKIIALCGSKFHGKDSVANIILKNSNYIFKTLSFARPIKESLSISMNIPIEYFDDPDKKEVILEEWGKTPRQLAQWYGTDVFRDQIDSNIWLKNMESRINTFYQDKKNHGKTIVITDARFDNELELVWRLGGKVWKVDASERVETLNKDTHISEHGITLTPDFVINNNGTLKELTIKVNDIINDYVVEYNNKYMVFF